MGENLMEGLCFKQFKKTYRNGVEAVKGFDLLIPKGSVHAFLGPNGAGKTTTLKASLGFIHYSGSIEWDGLPIDDRRCAVSYVPEEKRFYEHWTLEKTLKACEKMKIGIDCDAALSYFKFFQLPQRKKIGAFSLGMKTALYLSLAFSISSEYLILDEPTSGLDPIVRDGVLSMIREKNIDGKTVIYTSHIIPEVEKIADSFSIINKGELVYNGNLDEIKEKYRIFTFPRESVLPFEPSEETAYVTETDSTKVLTDSGKFWEKWEKESKCYWEVPSLESFFQMIVRRKQNGI
jgi:ABC-2 type transport system ATP-binding protein